MSSMEEALNGVKGNIAWAVTSSGRRSQDVELIAVTKTLPVETINEAVGLGMRHFGENKVQEIREKYERVSTPVSWHMIGHLQSNKVKYIIDKVCLIHSLDRMSLAKELEKRAAAQKLCISVLIQVNVAQEESKHGMAVEEVLPFIRRVQKFKQIHVRGLMTMAPHNDDAEAARPIFRRLSELKEEISQLELAGVDMDILSMGMSNDYMVAIEEGATMVRVGSAIFGSRTDT
ncbi:YggS family pyridoxal phosphate-dependent enzyme [Metallumcola ferriviriculae]|uniref:Pyridoxal phosphate homeostasis protein n=1 Tax=Metallumcola ferriviriculae TaxID=3039180 RepID=A0AAU0UNT3_9FIRM|nr:YggS family pyridoxal phosphate-dependent enzyme [Desulfitibacteraceae bacterium MK1]